MTHIRVLVDYYGMLTQEDKKDIAQIIHTEVDGLAQIVAKGFDDVDNRFKQVDKRFEQVDKRFDHVEKRLDSHDQKFDHLIARVDLIERDVSFIRQRFVDREEFQDVLARLKLVESRLGIVSGV